MMEKKKKEVNIFDVVCNIQDVREEINKTNSVIVDLIKIILYDDKETKLRLKVDFEKWQKEHE